MIENANDEPQKMLIEKLKSLASSRNPAVAHKEIKDTIHALTALGMNTDAIAVQAGLTMQYLDQAMAGGIGGNSNPGSRGWEFSI